LATAALGGVIVYSGLAGALRFGDAVANTDMGTSPAATDPLGGLLLNNQPPAPKYLNDHHNYPIVPIGDGADAQDGGNH